MTQVTIDRSALNNLTNFAGRVWHELNNKCEKMGPETERQIEEIGFDAQEADRTIEDAERLIEEADRRKTAAQNRLGELLNTYGALARSRNLLTSLHEACHALAQGQAVEIKEPDPKEKIRSKTKAAHGPDKTRQMPRPSGRAPAQEAVAPQDSPAAKPKASSGSKRRPTGVILRSGTQEARASQRFQRAVLGGTDIPSRDEERLKKFDKIQLLHSISEHLGKREQEGIEINDKEIATAIEVKFRDLAYTDHDAKNLFEFMNDSKNLSYKIAIGKELWDRILNSLAIKYSFELPAQQEA